MPAADQLGALMVALLVSGYCSCQRCDDRDLPLTPKHSV
jgi:hypothetical protein